MRDILPQPSTSHETVDVEASVENPTAYEGGEEAMAALDEQENLV